MPSSCARSFSKPNKAKTWFTLDVPAAAAATGEPRERIVAALNYLEEKGDLTLKVAGARQGYRRLRSLVDGETLAGKLHARFAEREERDVAPSQRAAQDGRVSRLLVALPGSLLRRSAGRRLRALRLVPVAAAGHTCRRRNPSRLGTRGAATRPRIASTRHARRWQRLGR